MRSHTDPAARREAELSPQARQGLALGAIGLLAGCFFTGGATSPLVLPLAAVLIMLVRHSAHLERMAPVLAGFLIVAFETRYGAGVWRGILGGLLLATASAPAWLWRREASRAGAQLARLDDILAQAKRGQNAEAPAAVEELADLQRALASLAGHIGARSVMVWDVNTYRGDARVRAESGGRPGRTVRLSGDPLGWAWEQGMRLRLEQSPRWAENDSVVVDRLLASGETGLLVTYAFDPEYLPTEEATFDQSAVYVRGIVMLQEAHSRAVAGKRRLDALLAGLDTLPGELDLERLATRLCETAMQVTTATGAAIGTWTGESGRIIAVAGQDGGPRVGDTFAPPASELALAVRNAAMIVRDAPSWTLGPTAVANDAERWIHRPRSMASLPLSNATSIIGVLAVWSAEAPQLEYEAIQLLPLLGPQVALHIEQAREFERIRETAERDPLTQLRNRRGFDKVFAEETVRFARHGRPLSLLAIDLDHFKAVNDQFGHDAGDDVLCRTARIIESSIRDLDTAARFGGEEFVVLLPETDVSSALDVAERIRAAVADARIEFRGRPVPIRASIGVTACPHRVPLPAELLASADAALYQAKAEGRDRVVAAPA